MPSTLSDLTRCRICGSALKRDCRARLYCSRRCAKRAWDLRVAEEVGACARPVIPPSYSWWATTDWEEFRRRAAEEAPRHRHNAAVTVPLAAHPRSHVPLGLAWRRRLRNRILSEILS